MPIMPLPGRSLAALLMAITISACGTGEAVPHERGQASEMGRRLVGVWEITLAGQGWMAHRADGSAKTVSGTIAFTEATHSLAVVAELPVVTNVGVYDLDFAPLGWTTPGGASAVAVARVTASDDRVAGPTDSVHAVLSPGADRFAVRMAGVRRGDSVTGVWSARAFSAGGGSGTFVLRRRARS